MPKDLDAYLLYYNRQRPHQGQDMNSITPYQALTEGLAKTENRDRRNKSPPDQLPAKGGNVR